MVSAVEKSLNLQQLAKLKEFGGRMTGFGVNFAFCDCKGELVFLSDGGGFKSNGKELARLSECVLRDDGADGEISQFSESNLVLAGVIRASGETTGVALVDLGKVASAANVEYFSQMLGLFAERFLAEAKAEEQIEMVSGELAQTYEELVLLHKLGTNMKVTESEANFLQMACDSLTDIVSVEGIAVLLEKVWEGEKQLVLTAGSGLIDIDDHLAAILKERVVEEIKRGREALLDSEVDSPFKYDWSRQIKNIIAVPLWGKEKTGAAFGKRIEDGSSITGLMVAINRLDKQDFDSIDLKLFNSVANGCAVFVDNGRLFRDIKELFIGSLRALTNSIDAKDQYTRGHSERVAFVSRWIAERLAEEEPLEQEQIHGIYLAGLLHDIGKMGVDESVLRKGGKLTEREMSDIKKHPSIGAGILNEIKQMRSIVPGVLCHHERIDGKGYPDGLTGEKIPLLGKIIGLADSFDAMTSKRTYRNAMTIKEALAEIEKGLGTQFDEKIGRIFINSDVERLWELMQDNFSEIYGNSDFSEYGAVAVGTLIR
jgi:HD-GYP domain-containing protein (c-di-GMP phosphodiesterase class II)